MYVWLQLRICPKMKWSECRRCYDRDWAWICMHACMYEWVYCSFHVCMYVMYELVTLGSCWAGKPCCEVCRPPRKIHHSIGRDYVCMYVCMYVCKGLCKQACKGISMSDDSYGTMNYMNVCMYACIWMLAHFINMYVCIMYVCKQACKCISTSDCMYVCTVCTYCMYVCMYVCMST